MHRRHPVPVIVRARIAAASVLARLRRVSPMRGQWLILLASLAGVVGGAALISVHAIGWAVIADSVFGVWFALARDVGEPPRAGVISHEQVLERLRAAP